MLRSRDGLVYR